MNGGGGGLGEDGGGYSMVGQGSCVESQRLIYSEAALPTEPGHYGSKSI